MTMKILVLAHDHESVVPSMGPDRTIGSGRQGHVADMGGAGVRIGERCDEARCEVLVEEQLGELLRQPGYSRSGAHARRRTPGTRGCPLG